MYRLQICTCRCRFNRIYLLQLCNLRPKGNHSTASQLHVHVGAYNLACMRTPGLVGICLHAQFIPHREEERGESSTCFKLEIRAVYCCSNKMKSSPLSWFGYLRTYTQTHDVLYMYAGPYFKEFLKIEKDPDMSIPHLYLAKFSRIGTWSGFSRLCTMCVYRFMHAGHRDDYSRG